MDAVSTSSGEGVSE